MELLLIIDLLVEYIERDEKEGRILVRPSMGRNLPFGDQFEKLLLSWSFLNVMGYVLFFISFLFGVYSDTRSGYGMEQMGTRCRNWAERVDDGMSEDGRLTTSKPLNLSPFTIDEFEQSLYHKDPYTPSPIMAEIHSCLINTLINDLSSAEPIRPMGVPVNQAGDGENDTDYWEGLKGATTETLRPIADDFASTWTNPIPRDRKGWESTLVGLLWERGTLTSLPTYLDNILHLTYEDKPAPTRPTWATAPTSATSAQGLIPSKPEKRYGSLHHTHKLGIIAWMIDMVVQTGAIRDYMEESMSALTEVRKEQVDVKREWKKM